MVAPLPRKNRGCRTGLAAFWLGTKVQEKQFFRFTMQSTVATASLIPGLKWLRTIVGSLNGLCQFRCHNLFVLAIISQYWLTAVLHHSEQAPVLRIPHL